MRLSLSPASASAINLSAAANRLLRAFGHQDERANDVACRAAARSSLLEKERDMTLERESLSFVSGQTGHSK
jgi:hypothetical protein